MTTQTKDRINELKNRLAVIDDEIVDLNYRREEMLSELRELETETDEDEDVSSGEK